MGVLSSTLPALEALAEAGAGTGGLDAIHALIERAGALLPRREASAVALLFADDDARWQRNLTERMTLAGAELGFRYDTFRRRSGNDRPDSHYDVLLALLADAMVETVGAGPSPGDGGGPALDIIDAGGEEAPAGRTEASPSSSPAVTVASTAPAVDDRPASSGRGPTRRAVVSLGFVAALLAAVVVAMAGVFESDDDVSDAPAAAPGRFRHRRIRRRDGSRRRLGRRPRWRRGTDDPVAGDGRSTQDPGPTLDVLESVPVEGCDVPLGGSMNPLALPEGLEALIADAFADAGGLAALGCPVRTVEPWDALWFQEFAGGESPAGRILADPVGGAAFWIDEMMYFHYERSGGGSLQTLGGLPVGTDYESPHPKLLLSRGGAMVAHYLGGPAHWVPLEALEVWNELGGAEGPLGLPMADIDFFDGRPGQEWSGGYGERLDDGTVAVELVDAAEIADAVAALPRRRNGILRLYDETAYWIDDQGRRRWIPDGATWLCLGGADALIEAETRGWVVGAFPPGPNATCP